MDEKLAQSERYAREYAQNILQYGIEESTEDIIDRVALYDSHFARHASMLEYIKLVYYNYLRDKYGSGCK